MRFLVVSIDRQELYLVEDGKIKRRYKVSTSAKGKGNVEGSGKTPTGFHRIFKKIGAGMPPDTVFVARKPVGSVRNVKTRDPIVARILWLEGIEEGINKGYDSEGRKVDTRERYIYIHGTTHEVGKPLSAGCIRMKPEDIVELFDMVKEGDLVIIF